MANAHWLKQRLHLLFAVCLLASGCANLTTFNRLRYDTAGIGETTFIDAKQRAVFAIPQADGHGGLATRICAEPSPDALSALAAAGNGSLSFAQKASAQAAFSLSETAGNIGLRTQSIQLMRDAMYRICEGVASGTVSSVQFETLYRRFQNSMVAILAIEQLTGVVKANGAQLSTTGSVGAAKEVAALAENTAKAQDASVTADGAAKTTAQKLADATAKRDAWLKAKGVTADTLTDAQKTEFAPLQKAVTDAATANAAAVTAATDAKEKLAIYQAGMQAVHGGDLATGGTATATGGTGGALDPGSAVAIADAVQAIVTEQLDIGFFRDACATLFDAEIDGRLIGDQSQGLKAECDRYAETTIVNTLGLGRANTETLLAQAAQMNAYAKYTEAYGVLLSKLAATPEKLAKLKLPPAPGPPGMIDLAQVKRAMAMPMATMSEHMTILLSVPTPQK